MALNENHMNLMQLKIGTVVKLQQIKKQLAPSTSSAAEEIHVVEEHNTVVVVNNNDEPPTEITFEDLFEYKSYPQDRDLAAVLSENEEGSKILNDLNSGVVLNPQDINKLTHILVTDLFKVCRVNYPKTEDKQKLANRIVKQFPSLAYDSSDPEKAAVCFF